MAPALLFGVSAILSLASGVGISMSSYFSTGRAIGMIEPFTESIVLKMAQWVARGNFMDSSMIVNLPHEGNMVPTEDGFPINADLSGAENVIRHAGRRQDVGTSSFLKMFWNRIRLRQSEFFSDPNNRALKERCLQSLQRWKAALQSEGFLNSAWEPEIALLEAAVDQLEVDLGVVEDPFRAFKFGLMPRRYAIVESVRDKIGRLAPFLDSPTRFEINDQGRALQSNNQMLMLLARRRFLALHEITVKYLSDEVELKRDFTKLRRVECGVARTRASLSDVRSAVAASPEVLSKLGLTESALTAVSDWYAASYPKQQECFQIKNTVLPSV